MTALRVALLLCAAVLAVATAGAAAGDVGGLPGAQATRVCAAAGPYWPTMTLALRGTSAWIACKEQARIVRVDTRTGRTLKSIRLRGAAIAVASGLGSIWAVDSSATLYRLNPASGRIARRIALGLAAPYNIWIGGGSAWVADDQGARVARVSPRTAKVVATHAWIRRRDPLSGLGHLLVFYGFVVLFIGTAILAFQDDLAEPVLGFDFWRGWFYLGYSLFLDVFGAALVVGLSIFAVKRGLLRPFRLSLRPSLSSAAHVDGLSSGQDSSVSAKRVSQAFV